MPELLRSLIANLKQFHEALSPAKRGLVYAGSAMTVVVLFAMSFWAGSSSYETLFRDLNAQDSAAVTKWLQENKYPYLVQEGGASIAVPPEFTLSARMKIMSANIIQADVVGYEIFNRDQFGMTNFVQKLNYKRAKEGELVRTVQSMHKIKRARVQLSLPGERTFKEDQEKPKASVFLELENHAELTRDEVRAISNLVGSAVEGLNADMVAIIDAKGRMLQHPKGDDFSGQSVAMLEYKDTYERRLERDVEQILSKVVGDGFVEARVNTDMDFKRVSVQKREYDADKIATVSTQTGEQTLQGSRPNPTGVPGSRSEIPGAPGQEVPVARQDVSKNQGTTNYAVPETNTQEEQMPGTVRRLSVAVIVDPQAMVHLANKGSAGGGDEAKKDETKEGEDKSAKAADLDPETKKRLENLVASTVGLKPDRGDQISIEVMSFARPDVAEGDRELRLIERRELLKGLIKYGLPSIFLLMFFLWVVRPFIRWITTSTTVKVEQELPKTIEELEALTTTGSMPGFDSLPLLEEQIDPDKAEGEILKEKIVSMVESAPQKAAQVVQEWLSADINPKAKKG